MIRRDVIIILFILPVVVVLCLLTVIIGPRLFQLAIPCRNTIVDRQLSPDGLRKAVAFVRDCGETTGLNTHVSLLRSAEDLGDEGGNTFIAEREEGRTKPTYWGGPFVRVRWNSNDMISLSYDPNARVSKKENVICETKVEYQALGPILDEFKSSTCSGSPLISSVRL
jgi:hypothetical protein